MTCFKRYKKCISRFGVKGYVEFIPIKEDEKEGINFEFREFGVLFFLNFREFLVENRAKIDLEFKRKV